MEEHSYQKSYSNKILNSSKKLWRMVAIGILIMILLEAGIQSYNSIKVSKKTTESLLGQVVSIVEKNEVSDRKLEEALKDEYIIRAKAVSYVIEHNKEVENNLDEMKKIADLMEVDEIHLFDKKGVIYNGSVPKYYGYNVDSGEQMHFFKKMLDNPSMSLCQNVTPNTAEGKEMMYAMVWREDLTGLVQVGIEPVRLLEEMRKHEISEVVDLFPVVEGEIIFIADVDTGVISGSTQREDIGKNMEDLGIAKTRLSSENTRIEKLHGSYVMSSCLNYGNYVIVAAYNLRVVSRDMPRVLGIVFLYLLVAVAILFVVVRQLNHTYAEKQRDYEVLLSMSRMYNSVHLINLVENTCAEYISNDIIRKLLNSAEGADAKMRVVMSALITDKYSERALEFTDLKTLPERLKGKKTIFCDVVGRNLGWTRITFITLTVDENEVPTSVIYTTQDIDEQRKEEEKLLLTSNTDELTELFNRRAFEQDMLFYENEEFSDSFLMVSMDLNGLKSVNDTLGHSAGDEVIRGAADCMRSCFGRYGKIYRMGGDEYVALLQITDDQIETVMAKFEQCTKDWKGKLVDSLSVSYGYVTGKEAKGKTCQEIEKLADERMYAAKQIYYLEKGIERRR